MSCTFRCSRSRSSRCALARRIVNTAGTFHESSRAFAPGHRIRERDEVPDSAADFPSGTPTTPMRIRAYRDSDWREWQRMSKQLFPDDSSEEQERGMRAFLARADAAVFIARVIGKE